MNSNFPTYIFFCNLSGWLSLGDLLCFGDYNWNLNNFTISGQFAAHIIISLFAGLVIAFPYVFWELWRFIKPALYAKETKILQRDCFLYLSTIFYWSLIWILFSCATIS